MKQWKVWIDYNRNGDFEDDEMALSKVSRHSVDEYLNIPSDVNVSDTRMRVIMSLFRTNDPCEDIYYGEIEDYTVVFGEVQNFNSKDFAKNFDEFSIESDIQIVPNPTADFISVNGLDSEVTKGSFQILNTIGQVVRSGRTSQLNQLYDVSELKQGMYFIQIEHTDLVERISFIKS